MKTKFKMFRRDKGVFYTEDTTTGKQANPARVGENAQLLPHARADDTVPLQPIMPPRRDWGIFGLGFYKDVAPTALANSITLLSRQIQL
jgi:hypothetical protein